MKILLQMVCNLTESLLSEELKTHLGFLVVAGKKANPTNFSIIGASCEQCAIRICTQIQT